MKQAITKALFLSGNSDTPNNPLLPVIVYRCVFGTKRSDKAHLFKNHYKANGWRGTWTDTIYRYRHFHTNAHEALGVAEGKVTLEIGGNRGKILRLKAGDLIILPAGTAHKRLSKDKVSVVGAYPRGQAKYDICRNAGQCRHAMKRIKKVPLPSTDPLYGENGPLTKLWTVSSKKKGRKS
jgi:uncharacterized protein YjlB